MPDKHTYNEPQKKAIYNYRKKTVSIVTLSIPKGKKAEYTEAASMEGKSLNRFILDAVDEHLKIEKDDIGSGK